MTQRTYTGDSPLIESRADLLSVFEGGAKPRETWRIGTEHEKFVYRTADHRAPSYDEPGGIRDLLMGLTEFGWQPVIEGGNVIALAGKDGTLRLDMMLRTCTIQVNLDYASEADMVKKFRVGLALQPIATALFANSPFTEGRPNGYKSFRSHIWEDTDPDRTGMLPFVFEDGFGYERYCDYALNVPMYFVYRDGKYIDVAGRSFRDFLEGKLPQLPGEKPRVSDFNDHLSTAFPEVRMKSFL